jgi:hypothetical protein
MEIVSQGVVDTCALATTSCQRNNPDRIVTIDAYTRSVHAQLQCALRHAMAIIDTGELLGVVCSSGISSESTPGSKRKTDDTTPPSAYVVVRSSPEVSQQPNPEQQLHPR